MQINHGLTDPLCENVHFGRIPCGELIKRMSLDAPNSTDSDIEVLFSDFFARSKQNGKIQKLYEFYHMLELRLFRTIVTESCS